MPLSLRIRRILYDYVLREGTVWLGSGGKGRGEAVGWYDKVTQYTSWLSVRYKDQLASHLIVIFTVSLSMRRIIV